MNLFVVAANLPFSPLGDKIENFQAPRHPKIEAMGDRTIPFGKEVFIERSDFFDVDGPEGEANGGKPPKGFKRLLPGEKVRLRYAYVIQCDEIIRDPETKEPVELKCTYFPDTRAGQGHHPLGGRKYGYQLQGESIRSSLFGRRTRQGEW
jgi:glutaminyl-tRNA synthetase